VQFESGSVTLAGTLVEPPNAKGNLLILTGSGRLDRDSNGPRFRGNINSAIADTLARRGIASLRYDKRGAGRSGGHFLEASFSDNYADACAAAAWLRTQAPERPLYAVGHSEGALHVAHLAADERVDGVVLIAPPVLPGEQILIWQAGQIVPTLPRLTRSILKVLRIDPLKGQRKALARIRATSANTIRIQGKKLNAGWLREFMDWDPTPVYSRIRVPVLVVIGDHDMQVPPGGAEAIAKLVEGPCEVRMIPGMSHILRDDPGREGPRGYRKALKSPVLPVVLEDIGDWVDVHLSGTT
jgi:alpha-beta hydrolase superfamily lysophospholipase